MIRDQSYAVGGMDIKFLAGSRTLDAGCRVAQWGAGIILASGINTTHRNLGTVEDGQGGIFVLAQLSQGFVPMIRGSICPTSAQPARSPAR